MGKDGFRRLNDAIAVVGMVVVFTILLQAALARRFDPNRACIENLYQMAPAIKMYADDYDSRMPPMQNIYVLGHILTPYLTVGQQQSPFLCPATRNTPYRPNAALSYADRYGVRNQYGEYGTDEDVEIMQDVLPHPDGKFTVTFLDGRVEHGGVDQAEPNQECVERIRSVELGITMYEQDYDERLPIYLADPPVVARIVFPYIKRRRDFICLATNTDYLFNSRLSGVALAAIPDLRRTPLVGDARPHQDGKYTYGFMDGHVERGGVVQPPGTGGKPLNPGTACLSRAKQVALGISMYIQDFDERLPPMDNAQVFETVLLPYVKNDIDFHCAETGLPFEPNSELSYLGLAQIAAPASTVTFHDPVPHRDGLTTYGFLDGHASRLP
jgi:prepilin-type processing-associated H-X9-DG protein